MKRYSKTIAQQCKHYEVENIFEYMVETYINGNHSTFTRLFKELEKDARRLFIEYLLWEVFIEYLLWEVNPQYHVEILKATI